MSGHQIKPASQLWKQNVQKVRPSLIFITCYPTSLPSIGFLLPFFIKWFYLLCLVWMEPGAVLSSGRVLSQKSEALFAFQPPSFFFTLDLICILFFSVLCFWNSACIPNGFNSPRGLFSFFSFLPTALPSLLPSVLPSKSYSEKIYFVEASGSPDSQSRCGPPKRTFWHSSGPTCSCLQGVPGFSCAPYLTLHSPHHYFSNTYTSSYHYLYGLAPSLPPQVIAAVWIIIHHKSLLTSWL